MIAAYSKSKSKWRTKVARIIAANPERFQISQIGKQDDGNLLLSEEEFASHFENTPFNNELVSLIWNDLEKVKNENGKDTNEVTFTAVYRWVNLVKKRKKRSKRVVYVCL